MRVVTLVDILLFDLLPFSPDAVLLHLQTEPSTREGTDTLSACQLRFTRALCFPLPVSPPGPHRATRGLLPRLCPAEAPSSCVVVASIRDSPLFGMGTAQRGSSCQS